jgi:hypothetical protein
MRPFDHQDYTQNPLKYRLFKTAVVRAHIHTHNGEDDLREGDIVGLEFAGDVKNPLYRRQEPIYRIKGTEHTLYANALSNFVL